MRHSSSIAAIFGSLGTLLGSFACASDPADPGADSGIATGGVASGGASMGGASNGGATSSGGSQAGVGGAIGSGGGVSVPVDCSGITSAGFELCETTNDSCGAVFTDSAGCTEVCAAAGLICESAFENVDEACAADQALPAVACDSGHQSDYCLCRGSNGGTGGNSGTGGSGTGTGGQSGNDDCNDFTGASLDVAKDGSGDFTTVQAALNSLSKSNTTPTVIRIAPGTYVEKLIVDRPYVTLCGRAGYTEETVLSYGDGASTSNGNGGTLGTSGSASVNLSASNVSAQHLTFANSRGQGTQAVALLVTGNRVQFDDCRFTGFQDTLYVKSGTQYFKDCHVEGSVDFIFGGATAVFENCSIHNVAGGTAITAPSTDQSIAYGLVFLGGEVTAVSGVSNGSIALGRNWHAYGAATFLETELGEHVSAVGWVKMGENTLATARFAEYETTGPGANPGARASDSSQLSASEAGHYTVDEIFGDWDPSFAE